VYEYVDAQHIRDDQATKVAWNDLKGTPNRSKEPNRMKTEPHRPADSQTTSANARFERDGALDLPTDHVRVARENSDPRRRLGRTQKRLKALTITSNQIETNANRPTTILGYVSLVTTTCSVAIALTCWVVACIKFTMPPELIALIGIVALIALVDLLTSIEPRRLTRFGWICCVIDMAGLLGFIIFSSAALPQIDPLLIS